MDGGIHAIPRIIALALTVALAWGVSVVQAQPPSTSYGEGVLAISGTTLAISPESQTVPFDTPTIVNTTLSGFDLSSGSLPENLEVVGDFTGPEIDGVLVLHTVPNEPFHIPRLSLAGQYALDNIRLVEDGQMVAYAEPRSAAILVTQILITRVTSRPLTLEEIRNHGIVVDGDHTRAYNFTFGFGVAGHTIDYNVPIVYVYPKDHFGPPTITTFDSGEGGRFQPPQMAPFILTLSPRGGPETHGCLNPDGCQLEELPPIPGVILFPTDLSLLHQFFSVILFATNGAPPGDVLTIRDLTAKIHLPSGLAAAETQPPTTLGAPVPMRVPGPDGQLGTSDDITFLVAQATAQAEFLVEGLREGTHIVDFDLEGVLEGLPTGIRRLSGKARGAVVVRDPTLGITISHPDVVRADEEYTMQVSITNTGVTPANLVSLALPPNQLAGVEVIGVNRQTADTILPGESELFEFRLRPLLTGRVVASFVRSDNHLHPTFDLHAGVGENGIPLSPTEIVLPREVEALPPLVVRHALGLVGLGFSLASAPAALRADRPQVSRQEVDQRVFDLAQAGRYLALGEEVFAASAELAIEWTGARHEDWEWDELRRTTRRGALFGAALGDVFRASAEESSATEVFENFAGDTASIRASSMVVSDGEASFLEVRSRASGKRLYGPGTAADLVRTLPFGDLFDLGSGELAILALPEPTGYRVTLRRRSPGVADLKILAPPTTGELRVWTWRGIGLTEHGLAVVDFDLGSTEPVLSVDADGDGDIDALVPPVEGELSVRPFRVLGAVQNSDAEKTGHVVDVLFTNEVDWTSLRPRDSAHFEISGKVSDGGYSARGSGLLANFRSSRVVRVVFNNPLSPYVPQEMTVRDVRGVVGGSVGEDVVEVDTTVSMPGTIVEGRVINADGQPIPFARVELAEVDYSNIDSLEDPCIKHVTAAVQSNAEGRFRLDYVRRTECSDVFEIRGFEPTTQHEGSAFGRVRFIGQVVQLDIVLLGRGLIRGRVLYDDGSVPAHLRVVAASPVFLEARRANLDSDGNFEVGDLPVGTISISAQDGDGNYAYATVAIPESGAVVSRDMVLFRQLQAPTGQVHGTVTTPGGEAPVYNAYLALYVGGHLVDVMRSDLLGEFDFGTVPAGAAEIEAFAGETGRSGARIFFEVHADQVSDLVIQMRDEYGAVQGHVYRRSLSGAAPLADAVVYAQGQPVHATTDSSGFYRLEGVIAGSTSIVAADLERQLETRESINPVGDDFEIERDLYFGMDSTGSGIAGEVRDRGGAIVAGALVHLALSDVTWSLETTTDVNGRFAFQGLAPGHYVLHSIRGVDGGRAGADISFAGETPFVTIRFKRGTIRGSVRADQEGGEPVGLPSLIRYRTSVVRFGLVGLDTESHDIETENDGTFEIPEVLAGPYSIEVFNAFYGSRSLRGELLQDGQIAHHDVLFQLAAEIEGSVVAPDGLTPVPGASVQLVHSGFSNYVVQTDEAGHFRFEGVPPDPDRPFWIRAHINEGLLFRDAQIQATVSRHGERLEVTIELPVQGSISGRVETAGGAAVPGAVVRLSGFDFPYQGLTVQSDIGGNFAFHNVLEGGLAVSALDLAGHGGKTTSAIAEEGETRVVLIRMQPVATVTGILRSPLDASAVPSGQVRLLRSGGLFDSATTDSEGRFLFDALPLGTYELRGFDPRTGRAGRRPNVTLNFEAEILSVDLTLEARGSVRGHLREPGSGVPVPGATIDLESRGWVTFHTLASTDADGIFEFSGIPQGDFSLQVREPGGFRRASGAGEIVHEGDVVIVDLYLQESGAVSGSVLEPLAGSSAPFAGSATVAVRQGSRLVGGTVANPYFVAGILADQPFYLDASENGGAHRGAASATLHDEGETVPLDVRMWAIGRVKVRVVDGAEGVVSGVEVRLTSRGPYGSRAFLANTGADGTAEFLQIGEGSLSVSAVDPLTQLRGSSTGTLVVDSEEVGLEVRLEPCAQLRATIRRPGGLDPADQALAVLSIAGRTYYSVADDAGAMEFPALPLGPFSLQLFEHLGPGEWHGGGSLIAAGQEQDLGLLILDAASPTVAAIEPADGAVAVPLSASIRIEFSEPIATSLYQSSWVELRRLGAAAASFSASWTSDRRTLTILPAQLLQSFASYQIKVTTGVVDLAGRHLQAAALASFTTLDALSPQVVSTLPTASALNVSVDTQIRLTFSEAVALQSLSGSALHLEDLDAPAGVETTFSLQPQGREVLVTPVANLVPDHRHRLTVQGVQDLVGNIMVSPFVLQFETRDETPPEIGPILPAADSTVSSGDTVDITAVVTDNQRMGPVTISLLGRTLTIPLPSGESTFHWSLTIPPVPSSTLAMITVDAQDAAGNGASKSSPLQVEPRLDPGAPLLTITCPSPGALVAPGTSLMVTAAASDELGLSKVEFFLDSSPVAVATFAAPPFRYRMTAPSTAREGDQIRIRVVATDYGLNSSEALLEVTVVEGQLIAGSRSITAEDLSFEHQSVIISGGTTTIDGSHSFRDLVILDGAKVAHRDTTPGLSFELKVDLDRDLFIACEGAVDTSGLGYSGGPRGSGRAYGLGNSQSEGASFGTGASHGGRGGLYDGSSRTYGSVKDPGEPGGGGGGSSASAGSDGGGVVRIAAVRHAVVDGFVRANGATNLAPGAAGGSVSIQALDLSGAGLIEANGGPGGGGGRVALVAPTIADTLIQRTHAWGGQRSGGVSSLVHGAAGTVFVRRNEELAGELIIDNHGLLSDQWTELPSVGLGIVDSVDPSGFTDFEADFRSSLVGADVYFNSSDLASWPILQHAHHGTRLGLDVDGHSLTLQAGATYAGLWRWDRLIVGGLARALTRDRFRIGSPEVVETGSRWIPEYRPPLVVTSDVEVLEGTAGQSLVKISFNLSRPADETVNFSFAAVGETATANEDFMPETGTVTIPAGGSSAAIFLTLMGDDIGEPDETLRVELSAALGAELPTSAARIRILDDDGASHCAGPELIQNGGAEEPPRNGEISGWVEEQGSSWVAATNGSFSGSGHFYAGAVSVAKLIQTVDISSLGAAVDNGSIQLALGAWIRSFDQPDPDTAEVQVEFRDAANTTMVELVSTGATSSPGIWRRFARIITAPPGARFAVVRLVARRIASGTSSNDAEFDDVSLKVIDRALVSISDVSIVEGTGVGSLARFPVSLYCAGESAIGIQVIALPASATAPADFDAASADLLFAPGEALKYFEVQIVGDNVDEVDERFTAQVSSPSSLAFVRSRATATIVDDDDAQLSVTDLSLHEGTGGITSANVHVRLSGPSAQTISASYSTVAGSATAPADFAFTSGTVNFAPGEVEQNAIVNVVPDALDETDEFFLVRLSAPSGAAITDGEAVITIEDDDENYLSIADLEVDERTGVATSATFTLRLSSPALGPVLVQFQTIAGSATPGADFSSSSGELTIAEGQSSADVEVPIVADAIVEPTETFSLLIVGAQGATVADGEAVATIVDDDLEMEIADVSDTELNSGLHSWIFQVHLNAPAPMPTMVHYSTAELPAGAPDRAVSPADFVAVSGVLSLPEGSTGSAILVDVRGDLTDERLERFLVRLSEPVNVRILDGEAVGSILDDEPPTVGSLLPSPNTEIFGGTPIILGVDATDVAGIVSVHFELDGQTFDDGDAPYRWETLAPTPSVFAVYPVRATATDTLGNSTARTWNLRVSAPLVPPVLDPDKIAVRLGLFGEEAEGAPAALFDLTNPPFVVEVRNLSTSEASEYPVALDGSFHASLVGANGDLFELRGRDDTLLFSDAVQVGPLTDDEGVAAAVPEGAPWSALSGSLVARCNCFYQPQTEGQGEAGAVDLQVIDLEHPLTPGVVGRLQFGLGDPIVDPCLDGGSSCFNYCEELVDLGPCVDSCAASCDPDDSECFEACYLGCGGARVDACVGHCDVGAQACQVGAECEEAAAQCSSSCATAGGGEDCENACLAFATVCGQETATPAVLYPYPFTGFDAHGGTAAMTQGPLLRVIDLQQPDAPVLVDRFQTLSLLDEPQADGDLLVGVALASGYAYSVERLPPNRLFVVDVHDPQRPFVLDSSELDVGTVDKFSISDGRIQLLRHLGSNSSEVVFRLGEGAEALLETSSSFVPIPERLPSAFATVDKAGIWLMPEPNAGDARLAVFDHSSPVGFAPQVLALGRPCGVGGEALEVGDLVLLPCGASEVAVASLDNSSPTSQLSIETWQSASLSSPEALRVAATRLWSFPDGRGYSSSALRPWLEPSLLSISRVAGGVRVVGSAGSAIGAIVVRATARDLLLEVPVAADGSFVLWLPDGISGEEVSLQAVDESGNGGNRTRTRMPLGTASGALDLRASSGAKRLAVAGDIAVVVPASVDSEGATHVAIAQISAGLLQLSEVVVEGPVSEITLIG
ncbi:MAG: carboxypeptidase regulatory-like domain-containing protein, partial [Thermoanaerobaculia bacterium]